MLVTFGLIIMIFYFLVIRPQNRRQKETKAMLAQLKKGDRVQTSGGIRGVVTAVKEDAVTVKVDDATKIEFAKPSITSIIEQRQGRVAACLAGQGAVVRRAAGRASCNVP